MNRQQAVYHRFIDKPQPQCCQNGLLGTFSDTKTKKSAEGQTRTVDTGIFSAVLYHLSYLGRDFYYRIRRGGCQATVLKVNRNVSMTWWLPGSRTNRA